jgi:3-methyladenine DNA glycosylase AlkD
MKKHPEKFTDVECKKYLKYIQENIHDKPNRGRSAMNWALIAIGTYKDTLAKPAIETAKKVGRVKVIHGTKNCKTPFAPNYIKKARAHRAKKKS